MLSTVVIVIVVDTGVKQEEWWRKQIYDILKNRSFLGVDLVLDFDLVLALGVLLRHPFGYDIPLFNERGGVPVIEDTTVSK